MELYLSLSVKIGVSCRLRQITTVLFNCLPFWMFYLIWKKQRLLGHEISFLSQRCFLVSRYILSYWTSEGIAVPLSKGGDPAEASVGFLHVSGAPASVRSTICLAAENHLSSASFPTLSFWLFSKQVRGFTFTVLVNECMHSFKLQSLVACFSLKQSSTGV